MKKIFCFFLIGCMCFLSVFDVQCNAQTLTQSNILLELPSDSSTSDKGSLNAALMEMAYIAYGLNFTDNDIQETTKLAKQYYEHLCNMDFDESAFSDKEIEKLQQRNEWLEQGVEITYNKIIAYKYINSCQLKHKITDDGPGTVLILIVTVPAAKGSGAWDKRVIEFIRTNPNEEWKMRSEGVL